MEMRESIDRHPRIMLRNSFRVRARMAITRPALASAAGSRLYAVMQMRSLPTMDR
jgi:hypothetical protein